MESNDFYCQEVFSGKTKVDIIEETLTILAFRHTKPSYEFHVVIVPKETTGSLQTAGHFRIRCISIFT